MKTSTLILSFAVLAPLPLLAQHASSIPPAPVPGYQAEAVGPYAAAIDELNAIRAQLELERQAVNDDNRHRYLQAAIELERTSQALNALVRADEGNLDQARGHYEQAFRQLVTQLRIARQS